jgi:hypothetical protein
MLSRKQHRRLLMLDVLNFLLAAVNLRTAMRKYHASLTEADAESQHVGHFRDCHHGHCHRHHGLRHLMLVHLQAHCRHHHGGHCHHCHR